MYHELRKRGTSQHSTANTGSRFHDTRFLGTGAMNLLMNLRLGDLPLAGQKIEVAALIGL
jgi:hypothetical protein